MTTLRTTWPKLICLWLLVCLVPGAIPLLPTSPSTAADDGSFLVAHAPAHTAFKVASRETVRYKAFRQDKRFDALTAAAGTLPALRPFRLSASPSESPFLAATLRAQFGRAPPSPLL